LQHRVAPFSDGVADTPISLDQALEDIGHEEEQVRGQGISLLQPPFSSNPGAGTPVHQDCIP
jgi:hypothetical protein